MHRNEVVIIGAGIAGLSAAREFEKRGIDYVLLEKSNQPGGRIRTISKDGFLLDAGFQVLHPNYPEVRNSGVWESLQFSSFLSGAFFSKEKNLTWYGNPFLDFSGFVSSGFSSPFPFKEYPAALRIFIEAINSDEDFQQLPVTETTMDYLRRNGFGSKTIEQFFKPFFGGVFLDLQLKAGSNYFRWLLKKFMQGKPGLPLGGMQSLPFGLVSKLPANREILFHTEVKGIEGDKLFCINGRQFEARYFLDTSGMQNFRTSFRSTRNIYLAGPQEKKLPAALILNGNPEGSVMHFCFPSAVQPSYAPPDFSLCSVTLKNPDQEPEFDAIRKELQLLYPTLNWQRWHWLESFYVKKALPEHQSGGKRLFREEGNVFFAGDIESYPSINGAMRSGREAAEMISQKLRA